MTSAAAQNGAVGTNAKSEPALIDPSACPRLLAAACWPSNAPGAAEWISSNSYDKTGPIIQIEVATIAIISPSDIASGVYEVNASAKAELTKAAAIKRWSIWPRTDEKINANWATSIARLQVMNITASAVVVNPRVWLPNRLKPTWKAPTA